MENSFSILGTSAVSHCPTDNYRHLADRLVDQRRLSSALDHTAPRWDYELSRSLSRSARSGVRKVGLRRLRPTLLLGSDLAQDALKYDSGLARQRGMPAAQCALLQPHAMQALSCLEVFAPQVAIIDIGLPGMNGYELAASIRANKSLPTPLMIALTGYGQAEDFDRSRDAGFDHHFVKPADLKMIQNAIDAETSESAREERRTLV